ncbi:hypothetical protein [Amycolatopsis sp. NPDC059021]|uniref:hypothetical protein n=1 Tax=Amycolatopsis sp. NPDC059021 TaxID=3346704 RepID=UPI00366E94A2
MTRPERTGADEVGALPTDPPGWRFAFTVFSGRCVPLWITLWLSLVLGGLVALGCLVGPWAPGLLSAAGGVAAGARALVKARSRK